MRLVTSLIYSAFGVPGQHRHTLLCGPTTCAERFQLPLTKTQGVVRTRLDALGKFVGIVLLYFCGMYACHIVRSSLFTLVAIF